MPRAPRKLSESTKKELVEMLHRNPVLSSKNTYTMAKSATQIKYSDSRDANQDEEVNVLDITAEDIIILGG